MHKLLQIGRLRYFGHVERMGQERHPHIALPMVGWMVGGVIHKEGGWITSDRTVS